MPVISRMASLGPTPVLVETPANICLLLQLAQVLALVKTPANMLLLLLLVQVLALVKALVLVLLQPSEPAVVLAYHLATHPVESRQAQSEPVRAMVLTPVETLELLLVLAP